MLLPRRGRATELASERLSLSCRTAKFRDQTVNAFASAVVESPFSVNLVIMDLDDLANRLRLSDLENTRYFFDSRPRLMLLMMNANLPKNLQRNGWVL
jgi:hypothetical protein